jgi:pyruvate,water dikinase
VIAALPGAPGGEEFASALHDYLTEFGLRQDLFELTVPTWREDPTVAIHSIQSYLRSGHDARAEHTRALAEAEGAISEARASISTYPEQVRGQFEFMLGASRAANFLHEEHNFYIDQRLTALTRLAFVRLGDRLVADGFFQQADDVFLLRIDQLVEIAGSPVSQLAIVRCRALVEASRDAFERHRRITPPPFVGTPPQGPPPMDNPMARALFRFFGGPPMQAEQPNQLKGNAGSRGSYTGRARIARTLNEAKALQPGEVLVAITTMPAWTPLFGVAGAVVTETGGALCHGAIVAREYGIPAVVGAFMATHILKDGQRVTVDGSSGIVTIHEE